MYTYVYIEKRLLYCVKKKKEEEGTLTIYLHHGWANFIDLYNIIYSIIKYHLFFVMHRDL